MTTLDLSLPAGAETIAALSAQITVELVWVTPALANEWLGQNKKNRNKSSLKVREYVNDMQNGRWKFAGDPIRFSWTGILMDGQHRLTGIVMSNTPLACLVIRGLDPEAQKVIDIGKKRSADDALRFLDYEGDLKDVGAIARGMLMYNTGDKPTQLAVVDYASDNFSELEVASQVMRRCTKSGGVTGGSLWGTAYVILSRIDEGAALEFFDGVATGAYLGADDPILKLRELFAKGRPYTARDVTSLRNNLARIFKAWNLYRQGRQVRVFSVKKGERITPA